jgi:hypothetical protein
MGGERASGDRGDRHVEIRNDVVRTVMIENGITISVRAEFRGRFHTMGTEVEAICQLTFNSKDGKA